MNVADQPTLQSAPKNRTDNRAGDIWTTRKKNAGRRHGGRLPERLTRFDYRRKGHQRWRSDSVDSMPFLS